jgi:hypothetical protein
MPFSLTSEQYVKIDEVAQALPPSRRHPFLVILAGKIEFSARVTHDQTLSDAVLSKVIDAALRKMRAESQRPADPHAAAAAKELDRLVKLCSNG